MTHQPRLLVMCRDDVEQRYDWPEPCAVLSITDPFPCGTPARIPNYPGVREVLRLEFMDYDITSLQALDKTSHQRVAVSLKGRTMLSVAMRDDQAVAAWAFLDRNRDLPLLILHCEAGASRSPSVAHAFATEVGIDNVSWYWPLSLSVSVEEPPNRWVYDVMMKARRLE